VKIPDPKVSDKVETAERIMLPDMVTALGLSPDDVRIPEDTVQYLVDSKTNKEKGMRKMKQLLDAILKRVAYLKHTLITLPPAAVWHAAQQTAVATATAAANPKLLQQQQQRRPTQEEVQRLQASKKDFESKTSFNLPKFQLPLIVTREVADKLLHHYKPEEFEHRDRMYV
jgi:ATP-dependent Lon protease